MKKVLAYTLGLALAVILTLLAFGLANAHTHGANVLPAVLLIPAILALAMVQLVVQLVCFLHFGRGKDSQWNAALFCFTFFGILVVVVASIWIMNHLNYNMTPEQVTQYINNQSGL